MRQERAQGVVEFAVVITMLMFFFMGTIDFSRFMYYRTAIANAARVGAEVGGNYCNISTCGVQPSPTSDDVIMQATYCEATQNTLATGVAAIKLAPTVSCTPCTTVTCDPCSSSACTACAKDICIDPLAATRTKGTYFTVYVGYNFQPISPLISTFFPSQRCWASVGSTENTHTLCATAVGHVASQ